MDTGDMLLRLVECDKDIARIDVHISGLQAALKDAKKAREEKVAELRGTIRDAARPIFQLLQGDGQEAQEAVSEHKEGDRGELQQKGRRRGSSAASEATL